jgi:hypothetical protein
MAHYALKITIQATRLPDPISPIERDQNPLHDATAMMREMASIVVPQGGPFTVFRQSGLTLGKEVEITAESFAELAKVMGQFDELADQVQCSNPVENS